MSTPNPSFSPEVEAINGNPIYFDGWETTLSADWDGSGTPPLTDWITLDTALQARIDSSACIAIEWTDDAGQTFRRKFVVYWDNSYRDCVTSNPLPDMATSSQTPWSSMPAGSRVYMPVFSADLQWLINTAPTCFPYVVSNGKWIPLLRYSPSFVNPDSSPFIFPVIDDTTTATALILLCYMARYNFVVLQCTLLTGEMQWFDLPPGYNGGGSGGGGAL